MIEPMLHVELSIGDQRGHLLANPHDLYDIISSGIKSVLIGKNDPNATPEQKRLALLLKTMIDGFLMMSGPLLLNWMYKSKDHPKPGKGDDLIEWYSHEFAKMAIGDATGGILVLSAKEGRF